MLDKLKIILKNNLKILEDDARAFLIDKYFGVSDGLDANIRLAILLSKGEMARSVLFGTNDEHQMNMMVNEANATGVQLRDVTKKYYDDKYLPFMEQEAHMAVFAENKAKEIDSSSTLEEALQIYINAEETVKNYISN